MGYCKHCGTRTMLMSGYIKLEPDAEPYESGKDEEIDLDVDSHIIVQYCQECEIVTEIINE